MAVHAHPATWSLRVLWLVLPFTVGATIGDAVDGRAAAVAATATVGAWIAWALVLLATAVPRPVTLTVIRFAAPGSVVVAGAAAWVGDVSAAAVVGIVATVLAAVAACSSAVADDFVDGGSYGPERRFSLRAPGALLAGPIPLVWSLGVAGALGGPLVAAAASGSVGARVLGVVAALGGAALVVTALRSLHTLSARFVVFVPRGLTLVDPLVVVEPVHLPRAAMARIGAAPAGTTALDLSQRALGLAVEVDLTEPVELALRDGRRTATRATAEALVVTPARPGSLLAAAREHRLPVG